MTNYIHKGVLSVLRYLVLCFPFQRKKQTMWKPKRYFVILWQVSILLIRVMLSTSCPSKLCSTYKPPHDKTNKIAVRPAKTQISLGIRPVWSKSSLSAWRNLGSLATHWAHSEDSDQTGRMPRLIWGFAGRTYHFVGLSSYHYRCCNFAYEHEYLRYLCDNGNINQEIYVIVETNIARGRCPHVDNCLKMYIAETAIYDGIHITSMMGTNRIIIPHRNKSERYLKKSYSVEEDGGSFL